MRATTLSLGRVTLFAELVQSARQFVDDSHRVPVGRIATVPHQRFLYRTKSIMILCYVELNGNTKKTLEGILKTVADQKDQAYGIIVKTFSKKPLNYESNQILLLIHKALM